MRQVASRSDGDVGNANRISAVQYSVGRAHVARMRDVIPFGGALSIIGRANMIEPFRKLETREVYDTAGGWLVYDD